MARVREPPGEQDADGMEADGAHNRANFPLAPSSLPLFRTTPTVPNFLTVDLTRTGSRKGRSHFPDNPGRPVGWPRCCPIAFQDRD